MHDFISPLAERSTFTLPIGWRGKINGGECVIVSLGEKGSVAMLVNSFETSEQAVTAYRQRGAQMRRHRRNSDKPA